MSDTPSLVPLPAVGAILRSLDKDQTTYEVRVVATHESTRRLWLIPNETEAWRRFAAGTLAPWSFEYP